ncbi:MAG TPA: efflux RND transporter periplasmic adaptor subunit [Cyclobacteriaceae bacterium]|nr:efflux RND transporter periplasmic adaptor subunit [Cyclobacteriaceae bacterium]HPW64234.1 efflux RND transporter periplasmic adaptor subunit [Cyclobacteriaceae bacterium]
MRSLYLLIIAAGIQACTPEEKTDTQSTKGEAIPVRVMALQKEESSPVIQTSGLFTTDDETNLAFKTGGIIEKIYVKEGDAIRKGQLLATINLTEIEAQVAQARLSYEKAKRDFQRVENLYKDSVATLEQFQNARTGMEVASRQLEAANFNRSYSEIRAVNNGFVLRKMASEGQVISSGTSVFQTNGAGQGKWILKTGVSDREWASVNVGDKATITTDALATKTFEAIVTRKSEGTDAMNGSFTLELTLKSPGLGLASGLFGKATIAGSRKQNVWKIPYDALLDGNAQSGYVFVTNDEKMVHKVPVVIGSIEKNEVVIQAGLENARKLIISGSAYLKDSSAIQIIK